VVIRAIYRDEVLQSLAMPSREAKLQVSPARWFRAVESLLKKEMSVEQRLRALSRELESLGCEGDPQALTRLPVAEDLARAERWFETLFRSGRLPTKANALRFAIVEYEEDVHDVYVAAGARRGEEPSDWCRRGSRYPRPRDAGIVVLSTILDPKGPIRDDSARHMTGLAYVASVAAHLCRKLHRKGGLVGRAVAAGYDDGDCLPLGTVGPDGRLELPPPPALPPAARARLAPGRIFELGRKALRQAWLLADLEDARTGRKVPHGFAQSARRERRQKMFLPIHHDGARVDLNVTVLGVPVVTSRFAALIERLAPGTVQRLPVEVEGTTERFEVLNILGKVSARKLRDWGKQARKPMCDVDLGKHPLVRVAELDWVMLIGRDLAQALLDEKGVGFAFTPLRQDRFDSCLKRR
jgi:hypothetical protein